MLLFFACLMLFMNFAGAQAEDSTIDVYGHAGGAMIGFVWGLGFFPRTKTDTSAKLRLAGMGIIAAFFIFTPVLFFLVRTKPIDPYVLEAVAAKNKNK